MEKTKLICVKLTTEQIEEIKKVNKLKKKAKPTHAIIWEEHGQIFGDEKLISRFWDNWTLKLSDEEKESHTDMRSTFLECIKDNDYKFESYEEKNFRDEISDIQSKLAKDLNARRMQMVEDEYQKALQRVRETSATHKPTLADKIKPVIFFIVAMIFMISVFSAIK